MHCLCSVYNFCFILQRKIRRIHFFERQIDQHAHNMFLQKKNYVFFVEEWHTLGGALNLVIYIRLRKYVHYHLHRS